MHFLFILTSATQRSADVTGMAKLAAAFGQDVSLWYQTALPTPEDIHACCEADIKHVYVSKTPATPAEDIKHIGRSAGRDLLAKADRVVRL